MCVFGAAAVYLYIHTYMADNDPCARAKQRSVFTTSNVTANGSHVRPSAGLDTLGPS